MTIVVNIVISILLCCVISYVHNCQRVRISTFYFCKGVRLTLISNVIFYVTWIICTFYKQQGAFSRFDAGSRNLVDVILLCYVKTLSLSVGSGATYFGFMFSVYHYRCSDQDVNKDRDYYTTCDHCCWLLSSIVAKTYDIPFDSHAHVEQTRGMRFPDFPVILE